MMNSSGSLDTDLLRTFLAVARHQNVTRGARALHLTQSAVSIQIKRLEEALQARLFVRKPRGVVLTEAGERLQVAARRIIDDLDRTVGEFRIDPVGGLVRIGIPDEFGSELLPAVLADFNARYPAVEVSVQCGFSARFPAAVNRGELDLAVFADTSGSRAGAVLAHDPIVWVGARSGIATRDEPVRLALFDRACTWRDAAINAMEAAGRPYRVAFSSESTAGIKAAIATGLAVGVLGRSSVEDPMQVLDERHGFPPLPDSVLLLHRGPDRSAAIDAMAATIEDGFARLA